MMPPLSKFVTVVLVVGASCGGDGPDEESLGAAPACQLLCSSVDDCVKLTEATLGAIGGADTWECNAGRCQYLGCRSDDQCITQFDENYVCRPVPGLNDTACFTLCSSVSDCASEAFGDPADVFACSSGLCVP